jgi:hypothetical protein
MTLAEKIVALHEALQRAGVPHAFGGALALAWCTKRARGTIDVDVNLFVRPEQAAEVLQALPPGVAWARDDASRIERDGQARLWWDATPVDLFFSTTDFHDRLASRVRHEPFLGVDIPFLACRDLAVFKAFFDRTRDWADLEEMAAAGSLDVETVLGVLAHYLGGDDSRVGRLRALGSR